MRPHPLPKSLACLLVAMGFGVPTLAWAQDVVSITAEGAQVVAPSAAPPDVYVVQSGDTLWDISTKFLGNAFYWPRLWSINEHITNPHWIYPGNRIIFTPGTEIEPPGVSLEGDGNPREGFISESVAFEDGDLTCGPDMRYDNRMPTRGYRAPAVMEDSGEMELIGKVYKARTGQTDLGQHDLVYLDVKDPDTLGCGDVVTILRRVRKHVRHPERFGTRYGALYLVVGEAKVLHLQDDIAMAVVRENYYEVRRGDLLTTKIPVSVELEVNPPKGSLEGVIVARAGMDEFMLASTEETVFLDRGKSDGVRVGNSFYVVERRDEREDMGKEDPRLPPSVIGRVVVVRVDENSSTGVVVEAARPLEVGTRVTMRVE